MKHCMSSGSKYLSIAPTSLWLVIVTNPYTCVCMYSCCISFASFFIFHSRKLGEFLIWWFGEFSISRLGSIKFYHIHVLSEVLQARLLQYSAGPLSRVILSAVISFASKLVQTNQDNIWITCITAVYFAGYDLFQWQHPTHLVDVIASKHCLKLERIACAGACTCTCTVVSWKGPRVVHFSLGLDWEWANIRGITQVTYPQDLHNSNSSRGYYWFQPYSSTVTNQEWGVSYSADTSPCAMIAVMSCLMGVVTITSRAQLFSCWNAAQGELGLVLRLFGRLIIDLTLIIWSSVLNQPFELPFSRAATCTHGHIFE